MSKEESEKTVGLGKSKAFEWSLISATIKNGYLIWCIANLDRMFKKANKYILRCQKIEGGIMKERTVTTETPLDSPYVSI
jgi:hypothetical protein